MGEPVRRQHVHDRPHLEGWKEIASYFGRTVRTVQRWERQEGLPVRRHPHHDLASVYADPADLDAWRARHHSTPSHSTAPSLGTSPGDERVLCAMAKEHWKRRTREGFQQSLDLAHAALAISPDHAPAYAMLAQAHQARATYGYARPADDLRLARAYVDRALRLEPDSIEALQALAFVHLFMREWTQAESVFEHLSSLARPDATTLQYWSLLRLGQGRYTEACALSQDAEQLEPDWPLLAAHTAWALHSAGRFIEAIAKARGVVDRDRIFWRGYFNLTLSLLAVGRTGEAVRAAEVSTALHKNPCVDLILVHALCRDGRGARAEALLTHIRSRRGYVSPYWHAFACAGLGDDRGALEQLRRSVRQREWFVIFVDSEPGFSSVRAQPGYPTMRTSLGLP